MHFTFSVLINLPPTPSGFPAARSRGERRVRDQTNKQKDLQKIGILRTEKKDFERKKIIQTNKKTHKEKKTIHTKKQNVCKERNTIQTNKKICKGKYKQRKNVQR